MTNEFAGDYHPAGATSAYKRRALARRNGRRGGLASGIRRRQLAAGRPPPRSRSRAAALALAYPHRQLTRARFDALYGREFPEPERPSAAMQWRSGRETLWRHYLSTFKLYRACGQHARTTNGQRAAALVARGRPRCRRTIQRLNRKLEAMGAAFFRHHRDGGWRAGRRDCLVVEIRSVRSGMSPRPYGAAASLPFGSELAAAAPQTEDKHHRDKTLLPPASPTVPPNGGDQQPDTEIGGDPRKSPAISHVTPPDLAAAIEFAELKLRLGWTAPALRAELHHLKAQLRASQATAGAPRPERDSGDRHTSP